MKRDDALKQVERGLEELNEALAAGQSERLTRYLEVMAKFHRYSFGNVILILMQRPDATHVAGFLRWKDLGRNVKKGAKGIGIFAPLVYKKKDEDADDDDKKVVRGFKVVHVFDVSDTEGEELPEFATVDGDPGENLARIEQVIRDSQVELVYEPLPLGTLGRCSEGMITISPHLSDAEKFAVAAHELSHHMLHQGERRHETTKKIRETEAEAAAFVVCRAFGLNSANKSADYIQLYRGTEDTLAESLEHIQRVSTWIIERVSEAETSVATPELALAGSNGEPELRTGRADYEERRSAGIDRFRERAEKRQSEAEAAYAEATRMADAIPFGQPILVGHHSEKRDRNFRARIDNKFGKAFELGRKAQYWEGRAEAAENSTAISSDDPTAIGQLKGKLASLEADQHQMRAINAAWRACGKPAPDDSDGWRRVADHPDVQMNPNDLLRLREDFARLISWQPGSAPFPSYSLANNSAEIRRVKQRIDELAAASNAQHVEEDHGVCRYVENVDEHRVQLFFDGKPPQETRDLLKRYGLRWSRRNGAWQRLLNNAGKQAARFVISQLTEEGR